MDQPQSIQLEQYEATSTQFLGQWNQLVSTTNWEKGRIIDDWREALAATDAPVAEYSDEAWSRRVGNVSPQHVGRLRRVSSRFREAAAQYPGLFWSHFQAALDWDDAEMWLEGAVQSKWSVSQMREKRWETMGSVAGTEPRQEDIVSAEMDEDAPNQSVTGEAMTAVRDPEAHDSDDEYSGGENSDGGNSAAARSVASEQSAELQSDASSFDDQSVRPFAEMPELPDDLNEAFEAFKLAILRHKTADWQEVSLEDVLRSLGALRALAMAPSGDD